MSEDRPKSLGDPTELKKRLGKIHLPHIKPLTEYVLNLRKKMGPEASIPFFDPLDGGIEASTLLLLEAPGAKARNSGFVSRNNPDESAKNIFELLQAAKIPRKKVVIWNIVPWYIGSKSRIRAANSEDISKGVGPLLDVIELLPNLRVAVLLGKNAQKAGSQLTKLSPSLSVLSCPHPSPLSVNRWPQNRGLILDSFRKVAIRL